MQCICTRQLHDNFLDESHELTAYVMLFNYVGKQRAFLIVLPLSAVELANSLVISGMQWCSLPFISSTFQFTFGTRGELDPNLILITASQPKPVNLGLTGSLQGLTPSHLTSHVIMLAVHIAAKAFPFTAFFSPRPCKKKKNTAAYNAIRSKLFPQGPSNKLRRGGLDKRSHLRGAHVETDRDI